MKRNNIILACILASITFFMISCMTNKPPGKWLPTAKDALHDTFGAWIVVENSRNNGDRERSAGEFIAYQEGILYVLTENGMVSHPVK